MTRNAAARFSLLLGASALATLAALTTQTTKAHACGCFAPPDPSVPIVQAGERIVFEANGSEVKAHIQIQYAGENGSDFAWIVPVPSIPTLGVSTSEIFTQVINSTQPKYQVTYQYRGNCPFDPARSGGGFPSNDSEGGDGDGAGQGGGVLEVQGQVGPYDFAVLNAGDKQAMLDWLADNGYFVPAGTADVADPYIREGAYFLALKLQAGRDAGDIQPLAMTYKAARASVPIELTAVAAQRDMGVQIWMLGSARAIPTNYFHTIINDAKIDWFQFGVNYADVVTNAVDEADGHHSFVTEYAGSSSVMADRLFPIGRFGNPSDLRGIVDPLTYISYLNSNGFPVFDANTGNQFYTPETLAVLGAHLPVPPQLAADGVTATDYYFSIEYWLGFYRDENPEKFTDADLDYDPLVVTMELQQRVIEPTREAQALFDRNRYMTRLFTTLSPNEMVKDPVFSFNRDLPEVSNIHVAEGTYYCGLGGNADPATTPLKLETEQGHNLEYPEGNGINPFANVDMKWALKTQILREEGGPEDVQDNSDSISNALDIFGGTCSVAGGKGGALGTFLIIFGALFVINRRRRRSRK